MPFHSSSSRFPGLAAAGVFSMAALSCAATPAHLVAVPVTSAVPAGLVTTVQKPNGSGIAVRYRVSGNADIHQPVVITLIFDTVTDDAATVRFTADKELALGAAAGSVGPVSLPRGSSQLVLQATPLNEGLSYVNVFTTQAGTTSVISIPVTTGHAAPKLRKLGESRPATDGERIISLPVP